MNTNDNGPDKKPDWVNPANDRKTPYTEEEIDTFVEDFILGLDEQEWLSMTSERGEETAVPHFRGIQDEYGRWMVVMTHNTDIADGWEREAEDEEYFQQR